ncbi:M48 family metallopeptidase [Thiomicrorhabdus sp. Milos-T2]|uniref:M48 family metallopeptidase n=1 Tax=Thiomicrorhabdus sp. Milos-T2 TaxID=90814 RepID=UPI00068A8840|nr:M48 family metalloprotease [Thiomicrorhabdus sp. Milos-T2]
MHSVASIKNNDYKAISLKLVLALWILLLTFSAQAENLPDLGSPDLIEYDHQTEQELGRAFNTALHTQYDIYKDLEVNAYIRELGHKLASYTGNNRNYQFYIIKDSSINAFAGPNGVIGIHTGLIEATQSEDELAAVIAHEISHVTQNHLSRRYEYSNTQGSLNSIATLIAAILIGTQDPTAGMATLMGGMGYNIQQQLKNSRQHESEADAIGIKLLNKAGYNPHAMGAFFGRLSKANNLNTHKTPEILRTHPVSDNRLAQAENRAQTMKRIISEPVSHLQFIKMRIKDDYKLKIKQPELTQNEIQKLNCYQLGISHLKKDLKKPKCLIKMATQKESFPVFTTLLIRFYTEQNTKINKQELNDFKKLIKFKLELYPNNPSIPILYSRYLQKNGKTKEAIKLLLKTENKLSYKYELYNELAELYSKTKQESYIDINLAKENLEIGNIEKSQYFIKQAKETLNTNNNKLKQEIFILENKIYKLLKNKDKKEKQ